MLKSVEIMLKDIQKTMSEDYKTDISEKTGVDWFNEIVSAEELYSSISLYIENQDLNENREFKKELVDRNLQGLEIIQKQKIEAELEMHNDTKKLLYTMHDEKLRLMRTMHNDNLEYNQLVLQMNKAMWERKLTQDLDLHMKSLDVEQRKIAQAALLDANNEKRFEKLFNQFGNRDKELFKILNTGLEKIADKTALKEEVTKRLGALESEIKKYDGHLLKAKEGFSKESHSYDVKSRVYKLQPMHAARDCVMVGSSQGGPTQIVEILTDPEGNQYMQCMAARFAHDRSWHHLKIFNSKYLKQSGCPLEESTQILERTPVAALWKKGKKCKLAKGNPVPLEKITGTYLT